MTVVAFDIGSPRQAAWWRQCRSTFSVLNTLTLMCVFKPVTALNVVSISGEPTADYSTAGSGDTESIEQVTYEQQSITCLLAK
jgi:hypothetical protein